MLCSAVLLPVLQVVIHLVILARAIRALPESNTHQRIIVLALRIAVGLYS